MQKNVKAERTEPTRWVCSFAERRKLAYGSDSSTFFFAHIRTSGCPSRRVGLSVCAEHKINYDQQCGANYIVRLLQYKPIGVLGGNSLVISLYLCHLSVDIAVRNDNTVYRDTFFFVVEAYQDDRYACF